jgi:hypothetical protein
VDRARSLELARNPSRLFERIDDEHRAESLSSLEIFGVELVASALNRCLYDQRIPEGKLLALV